MCLLSTKPAARKQPKAKARSVRWVYDPATTLRLLDGGMDAALIITSDDVSWTYFVRQIEAGVYSITHVHPTNEDYETYTVDLAHGWCDCPSATHRRRPCKHALALAAALRWLAAQTEGGAA